jgi:hypothetical protein
MLDKQIVKKLITRLLPKKILFFSYSSYENLKPKTFTSTILKQCANKKCDSSVIAVYRKYNIIAVTI